jgi:hypothetical protein
MDEKTLNKTLMKHSQNSQKNHRKIYTSLWILKNLKKKSVNQKSADFCQMFVISKKKTIP